MKVCFVDESGDSSVLASPTAPVQPVFVLDARDVKPVTRDFLAVKKRFFPGLYDPTRPLDILTKVVKDCDLSRNVRLGGRNRIRQAILFLGCVFDILERHGAALFGRVWVKGIRVPMNERSVYTFSMQSLCATFQRFLEMQDAPGFVIADSRNKAKNSNVSHSIFTRKYKLSGDDYPNMLEMPTFGHDENHVGLQLADYLCSAVLYPMAIHSYCPGHVANLHVTPHSAQIKDAFRARLKAMQYRYDDNGAWRGGITVSDALAQRPGSLPF